MTMSQSAKVFAFRRAFQAGTDFVLLLESNAAFFDWPLGELRQRLLNPGKTLVEIFLLDFEYGDVESGRGGDLGDAGTH